MEKIPILPTVAIDVPVPVDVVKREEEKEGRGKMLLMRMKKMLRGEGRKIRVHANTSIEIIRSKFDEYKEEKEKEKYIDEVSHGRMYFFDDCIVWVFYDCIRMIKKDLISIKELKDKGFIDNDNDNDKKKGLFGMYKYEMIHKIVYCGNDGKLLMYFNDGMNLLDFYCKKRTMKKIGKMFKSYCNNASNCIDEDCYVLSAMKMNDMSMSINDDCDKCSCLEIDKEKSVCKRIKTLVEQCTNSHNESKIKGIVVSSVFCRTSKDVVEEVKKRYKFFDKYSGILECIEVPKKKKEKCIKLMKKLIKNGEFEEIGIGKDEDEKADSIIIEGKFRYCEVKRFVKLLSKYENEIEWLQDFSKNIQVSDEDESTLVISSKGIVGISSILSFFLGGISGSSREDSISYAVLSNLEPFCMQSFCEEQKLVIQSEIDGISGKVVASKLIVEGFSENCVKQPLQTAIKAGLTQAFEAAVVIPLELPQSIAYTFFSSSVFGGVAAIGTAFVFGGIETAVELVRFKKKKISSQQLYRNISETLTMHTASATSSIIGGAIGAVAGTAVNPVLGGVLGFLLGSGFGIVAGVSTKIIHSLLNDAFFGSDSKRMKKVFEKNLKRIMKESLLSEEDWTKILSKVKFDKKVSIQLFKAESKGKFIDEYFEPYIYEKWRSKTPFISITQGEYLKRLSSVRKDGSIFLHTEKKVLHNLKDHLKDKKAVSHL